MGGETLLCELPPPLRLHTHSAASPPENPVARQANLLVSGTLMGVLSLPYLAFSPLSPLQVGPGSQQLFSSQMEETFAAYHARPFSQAPHLRSVFAVKNRPFSPAESPCMNAETFLNMRARCLHHTRERRNFSWPNMAARMAVVRDRASLVTRCPSRTHPASRALPTAIQIQGPLDAGSMSEPKAPLIEAPAHSHLTLTDKVSHTSHAFF